MIRSYVLVNGIELYSYEANEKRITDVYGDTYLNCHDFWLLTEVAK